MRTSGYLRPAWKLAGLTIQPWILRPSFEGYQISSTAPRARPARTSSLTSTSFFIAAAATAPLPRTLNVVTYQGSSGVVRTAAAWPLAAIDTPLSMCVPCVTARTSPFADTKYSVVEPFSATVKYTPELSDAHVISPGELLRLPASSRLPPPLLSIR